MPFGLGSFLRGDGQRGDPLRGRQAKRQHRWLTVEEYGQVLQVGQFLGDGIDQYKVLDVMRRTDGHWYLLRNVDPALELEKWFRHDDCGPLFVVGKRAPGRVAH